MIAIRKAESRDVETIVRIANAGGPEGKPRLQLPDKLPSEYFAAFERIDADSNQMLMVAEIEGDVVGTFHLTLLTYLAGAGKLDAQIESIHVVESHRRQGIGTAMIEWAIQLAQEKQCRRVQLTTDKRRKEAHPFYQRLGFEFSHEGAKLQL